MIALSFLGIGNYLETTYVLGDKRHRTRFFSAALPHIFAPEQLFVIQTKEADHKHGEALRAECDYVPLAVPSGKNEGELWKLFEIMSDAVPRGATLLLDVTHGFRSQPMLGLAAAVYLQAAKDVTIERIVYGAYEARNESNESPVFDLTPLSDLIDWSAATRFFVRAGDARPLGDLLKQTHEGTWRRQESYRARNLSPVGSCLQELTYAMALVQPLEAAQSADRLSKALQQLDEDLHKLPQTRPFGLLLDQIQERLNPLAGSSEALFTPEGLCLQAAMIRYYLQANQLQQALTLSREALVSLLTVERTGSTDPQCIVEREYRKPTEEYLNELVKQTEKHLLSEDDPKRHLAELWGRLRDLRNNINHAGMQIERFRALQERKRRKPLDKLQQSVRDVCEQVASRLENTARPS